MIALIILLELTLLCVYFLTAEMYFLMSVIIFLVYVSWFTDGNEHTGFRQWPWMRKWSFGIQTEYIFGDYNHFRDTRKQYLFVAIGNETHMGLVGGFGLHGDIFSNLCYSLPHPLFQVPLLRDWLLWTGAVSDKTDLVDILRRGWSVCIAPGWMKDTKETQPDVSVFDFAIQNNIHVVPVEIKGENERYTVVGGLRSVQKWCMERAGWPFPFLCLPKWHGKPMKIHVGMPMDPRVQENAIKFRELFFGQLKRYV